MNSLTPLGEQTGVGRTWFLESLVDNDRSGRRVASVLRTKMAVSSILPGEATVPGLRVSLWIIDDRRTKVTYAMLQRVHTSGLSKGRPALRLCPSDFKCLARLSGFTTVQH